MHTVTPTCGHTFSSDERQSTCLAICFVMSTVMEREREEGRGGRRRGVVVRTCTLSTLHCMNKLRKRGTALHGQRNACARVWATYTASLLACGCWHPSSACHSSVEKCEARALVSWGKGEACVCVMCERGATHANTHTHMRAYPHTHL